jgi:hypothetical protein
VRAADFGEVVSKSNPVCLGVPSWIIHPGCLIDQQLIVLPPNLGAYARPRRANTQVSTVLGAIRLSDESLQRNVQLAASAAFGNVLSVKWRTVEVLFLTFLPDQDELRWLLAGQTIGKRPRLARCPSTAMVS